MTQRQNRAAVATGSSVPKAQDTEEALPAPCQTVVTPAMTRLTSLVKTILECHPKLTRSPPLLGSDLEWNDDSVSRVSGSCITV